MAGNLNVCCIKCDKTGGTVLCNGCNQILCFKHINEHYLDIEKDFQDLINQEDEFENNLLKTDDSHQLFYQIDQWKKDKIEQIKQIAKKTKENLRELINENNQNLLKESKLIKDNLYLLKQSQDLSENKLIHLTNQFNNLKNKINSFQLIKSTDSTYLKIEKEQKDLITPFQPSPPTTISIEKLSPYFQLTHSKKEGSILFNEIDPYGHFIIIEHSGLTKDKDQDMVGWTIKRSIDSNQDIIYRFPNDFILKSKSFIKILSRQSSETFYSYEKENILIAQSIQTWSIPAKTIINRLIDPNGDEKHILIQTLN